MQRKCLIIFSALAVLCQLTRTTGLCKPIDEFLQRFKILKQESQVALGHQISHNLKVDVYRGPLISISGGSDDNLIEQL